MPEVAVAEPLVGPPPPDESHIAYFDEAEVMEANEPAQEELPGIEPHPSRS